MSLAYIALGANLGDPAATLNAAFDALGKLPESHLLRRSALYRTAPIGFTKQPDFINAVAALKTDLPAQNLLDRLHGIEQDFGRQRTLHNGPRTLDLDLLLYDDLQISTPRLHLPHPRLHLRAFVVHPLFEIAPELALPGRGRLAAWLPAVATQGIARQ